MKHSGPPGRSRLTNDLRGPTKVGEISIEIRGVSRVPDEGRYGNVGRLFTMWVKMNPSMFFVGALAGAPLIGLGLLPAIGAIVLANLMGALLAGVFAVMGARTGVPQLHESRLAFGRAVSLPSALQWVTQIGFEALTLLFAAESLVVLFNIPFYVGAIIGLFCMGVISLLGYEVIHSFQKIVTGIFLVLFAILTISIVLKHPHVVQSSHGSTAAGGFFLFVAVALGIAMFCTSASDYSRYLPVSTSSSKIVLAVVAGLLLSMTWIECLGILASPLLHGSSTMEGVYDIVGKGVLGDIAMIAMALGAISIMVLTDYSGALAAQAAGFNLIRPVITVISALVAFGVGLWLHAGNVSGRFEDVLLLISYWVTPWAAIVAVHWWWRGRRMPGESLGNVLSAPLQKLPGGRLALGSVVALVVGFFVALPFSNTGLDATVSQDVPALGWLFGGVSRATLHGGDLDFYVGFVVAGIIYAAWLALGGDRHATMTAGEDRRGTGEIEPADFS